MGVCGGAKIFGSALLQPACSGCVSLSAFSLCLPCSLVAPYRSKCAEIRRKIGPLRLGFQGHSSSNQDKRRFRSKNAFFSFRLFLSPSCVFPSEFRNTHTGSLFRMIALADGIQEKFDDMCIRLDTIPQRDRQTDRQKDGRTTDRNTISVSPISVCWCMLMHDNNGANSF